MGKRITRSLSYSSAQQSRRLEIFCLTFFIGAIIVGTLTLIFLKRGNQTVSGKCGPQYIDFSINISDAEETDGSFRTENGMIFPPGTFWKANGSTFGCPCSIKPCIRKCCPPNQEYDPNSNICVDTETTLFEPLKHEVFSTLSFTESVKDVQPKTVSDDHFFILHGDVCGNREKFLKNPEQYDEDKNFLMEDGTILTMGATPYLDQSQYCLESFVGSDVIHTMECFEEKSEQVVQETQAWIFTALASGMIVSIPFLLATFLVYALLPQLQNLHGKALMCHVASLMVAYTALSIVQIFNDKISMNICILLAYIIQFAFLASFFWLNVMCFDIWWVFSGLMPLHGSIKEAEHKKFVIYSSYAWGGPLCISSTTAILDLVPNIPSSFIKPQFGIDSCWFKGDDAVVLFFYLPIGVLVCLNLLMFTTTSCRLCAHASDSKVLRSGDSCRHDDSERQRFNLYLKLFVVMGVSWVMELVSFIVGGNKVHWLATDLANTLQGLLIFLIFVCKRRILRLLNRKLCPSYELVAPSTSMRYNSSRYNSSRFSRTSSSNLCNSVSQNPNICGPVKRV